MATKKKTNYSKPIKVMDDIIARWVERNVK